MKTTKRGLLLVSLFCLTATLAEAQEPAETPDVDSVEPAVSSEALAQGVDESESNTRVIDTLELGRTTITGNQELPKVLYIVPWKQAAMGELIGRPVNSLLDEVLSPIDREVFKRQVSYYGDLYDNSDTDNE